MACFIGILLQIKEIKGLDMSPICIWQMFMGTFNTQPIEASIHMKDVNFGLKNTLRVIFRSSQSTSCYIHNKTKKKEMDW